jgi:hypothetical protein
MSDFRFACPHCAQRLRCDERHAGRQILCPKCQQRLVIPSPSRAAAGAPPNGNPQATMNAGDSFSSKIPRFDRFKTE